MLESKPSIHRRRLLLACLTFGAAVSLAGCADSNDERPPLRTPSRPPTGIAFISTRDSSRGEIYTMDIDGGNVARLTQDTERDIDLAISPDGTKFAFSRKVGLSWHIFTMNIDGSDLTQLTSGSFEANVAPSWRPNGERIVFSRSDSSERDALRCVDLGCRVRIWSMRPDGTNRKRLTAGWRFFDMQPAWSPDGKKIAFARVEAGGSGADLWAKTINIWVMGSAGNEKRRLSRTEWLWDEEPTWNHDGSRIVFIREGEVWTMKPNGKGKRQVTFLSFGFDVGVEVAPDDAYLLFTRDQGGRDIYRVDWDGSNEMQLTTDPGADGDGVWLR